MILQQGVLIVEFEIREFYFNEGNCTDALCGLFFAEKVLDASLKAKDIEENFEWFIPCLGLAAESGAVIKSIPAVLDPLQPNPICRRSATSSCTCRREARGTFS